MAQKTRSSGSRTKRNSSSGTRSRTRNSTKSRNGTSQTPATVVTELAAKAKPQAEKVKRTGRRTVAKAKTPLLAGGAALAGLAGGVALKSRTDNRRPVGKLRSRTLPKVDIDKLTEIGHRMRAIGEQVGDLADAAEKTRKKHK